MKKGKDFYEYVLLDLFSRISGITSKNMFSGWGIYKDGVIFAFVNDGELYCKVGDNNRADYEKYDSKPFTFMRRKNKQVVLSYWLLPEEIMEDRQKLELWIEKSLAVSQSKKV